jgi:energy-coupling factor transporter ATP-binding protein EcfA2
MTLSARAAAVAADAEAKVGGRTRAELARIRAGLAEPLRIAIAGQVSSGKSTLVNALLRQAVAPTDAGECTQVVTEFRYAAPPSRSRAEILLRDGSTRPLALRHGRLPSGQLDVRLDDIDLVRVWLDNPELQELTVIDTPGLNSAYETTSSRTKELLRDEDSRRALGAADIVLFVVNAALNADLVELLREYVAGTGGSAMTVLGILSRADLVGNLDDPWDGARTLADRHAQRLRREMSTVLPVLGLLAQTAETYAMTEEHAADIAALADLGIDPDHPALWSADHFLAHDLPIPLQRRRNLLDILDVYGLKTAIGIARGGARNAAGMQQALSDRTGLRAVRVVLGDTFARRADALKTSKALDLLHALSYRGTAADAPALAELRSRIEELRDDESMHQVAEFQALRECLNLDPALDAGTPRTVHRARITAELYEDVLRLVRNTSARQRCGLAADATDEELMLAAKAGAAKWMTFGNRRVGPAEKKIADTIHHTYTLLFLEAQRAARAGHDPAAFDGGGDEGGGQTHNHR